MTAVVEESKVVYNFLGKSGLKVANICLGTMTFGESVFGFPGQLSAHSVLDRYVEWGGNFIDTADVYSAGTSEQIIGTWLAKQEREKFAVATKVRGGSNQAHPNKLGLSRRHIVQSIDDSLQRLQTNYVDLYQMHLWDDAVPIEETLRAFDDLVRCGKVRYIGISNVVGWQMQKIIDVTEKLGLNPCISLQQQYSLACRESEFEAFQVCKLNGLGVLPWSPLKGGILTGKVKRDTKPTSGRVGWVMQDEAKRANQAAPGWTKMKEIERIWNSLAVAETIGKKHGKSVPQVAIRWLLQKDIVPSVIIGATTLEQLDDNMGAASGWKLSEDEMNELDDVSMPDVPYPYEMLKRENKSRVNPFNQPYAINNL